MAYNCDLCEDEGAVLLQTNLENGDTVAVGAACYPTFLLSGAAAILRQMPAEVSGEYANQVRELASIVPFTQAPKTKAPKTKAPAIPPVLGDRDECPGCGEMFDQDDMASHDCPQSTIDDAIGS